MTKKPAKKKPSRTTVDHARPGLGEIYTFDPRLLQHFEKFRAVNTKSVLYLVTTICDALKRRSDNAETIPPTLVEAIRKELHRAVMSMHDQLDWPLAIFSRNMKIPEKASAEPITHAE
jgi:hypothetical protein